MKIKLEQLHVFLAVVVFLILIQLKTNSAFVSAMLVLTVFSALVLFKFENNLRFVFFLIPSVYYFAQLAGGSNPITYYLILLFLKYLFFLKNKRFDVVNVILALVIVGFELVNLLINDFAYIAEVVRWSLLFLFATLLMSERSNARLFSSYANYFIAGYFASSVLGLIIFYQGDASAVNINAIKRFSGLSGDPNSYGLYAVLVLSFLLPKLGLSKESFLSWSSVFIVGFFSVLTVSRTLLICYVAIIMIHFLFNLRSKKDLIAALILIAFLYGALLFWGGSGLFDNYSRRFDHSDLAGLTGSRSVIFAEYISGFFDLNVLRMLFGAGVSGYLDYYFYNVPGFNSFGYFYQPVGPHNTVVELLVSFGFIGSAVFLILMFRCMFEGVALRRKGHGVRVLLPFVMLVIYSLTLQNLGQYVFYFMLLLVSLYIKEKSVSDGIK